MADPTPNGKRHAGRPRRFDEATERKLLLDAGMKVMRRNGFTEASLADVLRVAGLSTRAFYRHFETKDALLMAMFHRDAELVATNLGAVVDGAPDAVTAVDAYLDEYLDVFCDPRRASRVRVLKSEGARRAAGFEEAMVRMQGMHASPLANALRLGNAQGSLGSTDPDRDARTVLAVIQAVADDLLTNSLARGAAYAHVVKFCWPAIGREVPEAAA